MSEFELLVKFILPSFSLGVVVGFIVGTILKYIIKLISKIKKVLNE